MAERSERLKAAAARRAKSIASRPPPEKPKTGRIEGRIQRKAEFEKYLSESRATDRAVREHLRAAAAESDRILRRDLLNNSFSSRVRKAQYERNRRGLNQVMNRLWGYVHDDVRIGFNNVTEVASDNQLKLTSALAETLDREGSDLTSAYFNSFESAAKNSAEVVRTQVINAANRQLSPRVYKNASLSSGAVNRIVLNGLALNQSAAEIAREVRDHISPGVKGGTAYAAMRLARTEINNAYHENQIRLAEDNPAILAMQWNLSKTHTVRDECDRLAEQVVDESYPAGVYPIKRVPFKSHPHCLCHLTAVTMPDEAFDDKLLAGEFDDWLIKNGQVPLGRTFTNWTDEEIDERVELVDGMVNRITKIEGGDTESLYDRLRDKNNAWTPERTELHEKIVAKWFEEFKNAPRERKAVMMGGPSGAGKGFAIQNFGGQLGIERDDNMKDSIINGDKITNFMVINPDVVKEYFADIGLVPDRAGFSPMELSNLTHEEASHITKILGRRGAKKGINILWDMTMNGEESTAKKILELEDNKYEDFTIGFVDAIIEETLPNIRKRYGGPQQAWLERKEGLGGRPVPKWVIAQNRTDEINPTTGKKYNSANLLTMEKLKSRAAHVMVFEKRNQKRPDGTREGVTTLGRELFYDSDKKPISRAEWNQNMRRAHSGQQPKKALGQETSSVDVLAQSRKKEANVRLGRCYELSGQYATSHSEGTLIHGSIQGMGNPRIGHAWVEFKDGSVWEPITDRVWDPRIFKSFFHPEEDRRYENKEVLTTSLKTKHWGPWGEGQEAEVVVKDPTGRISKSTRADPRYQNLNKRTLAELEGAFPSARKVTRLTYERLATNRWAQYKTQEGKIEISREIFSKDNYSYENGKILKDAIESLIKSGWWPKGTSDIRQTLVHEFGHHLHHALNASWRIDLFNGVQEVIKKSDPDMSSAGIKRTVIKQLGEYSARNFPEIVTAAFTQYWLGKGSEVSPIAKYVGEFFIKAYR